jgi:uncharacterized protein (DUF983 family)
MTQQGRSKAGMVSLALNPAVLTGVFVIILAWQFEPTTTATLWASVIAVTFVTLVPIASLFALVKLGKLTDVEMRVRSERDVVYGVCLVSYVVGAALLVAIEASWQVWGFMALHVPNTIIISLLNRRWKVSIHAATIAGVCAAAIVFFGTAAAPALLLLPIAAWGRWAAGAHSKRELLAGAALGTISAPAGIAFIRFMVGG